MVTINAHSQPPVSRLPGLAMEDVELAAKQAAALEADAGQALGMFPQMSRAIPRGPIGALAADARELMDTVNAKLAAARDTARKCERTRSLIDLLKTPLANADLGPMTDWFKGTAIADADLIWTNYVASSALLEMVVDATASQAIPGFRQNLGRAVARMRGETFALADKLRAAIYGEIELKDVLDPSSEMRLALPHEGAIDLRTLLAQLSAGLAGSKDGRAADAKKALDEAVASLDAKDDYRITAALEHVYASFQGVVPDLVGQLLDAHRFVRFPQTVESRFASFELGTRNHAPLDRWLASLPIGSHVAVSITSKEENRSTYLVCEKAPTGELHPFVAYTRTVGGPQEWRRDPDALPEFDIPATARALALHGQNVLEARMLLDWVQTAAVLGDGWGRAKSPLARSKTEPIALI
jgi:hypothetical protein